MFHVLIGIDSLVLKLVYQQIGQDGVQTANVCHVSYDVFLVSGQKICAKETE